MQCVRQQLCGFSKDLSMGRGRCGNRNRALAFRFSGSSGTGNNAAFYNQSIFVISAIGIQKGCFIVCVEKVLFAERYDLIIQPVQQGLVALGDGCRNGVRAAEGRNADRVSGILNGKCDDLGIVICPCNTVSVFKCSLGLGVSIILLKLDVRMVLFQIRFSGRAGDDDDFIICTDFIQTGDHCAVGRNDAQCYVHVRKRKVDFLRAFLRYREVRQNDIYLAGLQILNSVCSFRGDIVDCNAKVLADSIAEVDVVPLIFTVLINITERTLVGEYANVNRAALFDFVDSSI